jgi:hypothetical protein
MVASMVLAWWAVVRFWAEEWSFVVRDGVVGLRAVVVGQPASGTSLAGGDDSDWAAESSRSEV